MGFEYRGLVSIIYIYYNSDCHKSDEINYLLNAFRLDKKRKECTFAYEVIWYLVFTDQTAFTITSYNAKNIFLPKNMNANFELK